MCLLGSATIDHRERELKGLEEASIISPVKHSEWAAPIVPVVKKDLCLCGYYKVSVTQALETEGYPLPDLEELLATFSAGKILSKIDFAAAYQQVLRGDHSRKYTSINTHKGLFVYNRLRYLHFPADYGKHDEGFTSSRFP